MLTLRYDDPMLEPTARGYLVAREPLSILVLCDEHGLKLLAIVAPELLDSLGALVAHPNPPTPLTSRAAILGSIIRLATREGYRISSRPGDEPGSFYIDLLIASRSNLFN